MTCLNDSHIQALADGESLPEAAQHAAGCAACAARVRERGLLMAAVERELGVPVAMPASLVQSVGDAFRLTTCAEATVVTKAEATRSLSEATLWTAHPNNIGLLIPLGKVGFIGQFLKDQRLLQVCHEAKLRLFLK